MNKYLLLRDNKQSGPYTYEELKAKGIKAYDLVWIEGKSAAWRYPSEVEELKPYAPVIEEQPFERFYKKPAEQSPELRIRKEEILQPVKSEPVTKKIEKPAPAIVDGAAKKVYINFPASATPKSNQETESISSKDANKPLLRAVPVIPPVQQQEVTETTGSRNLISNANGGSVRDHLSTNTVNTVEKYPSAQKPSGRPILTVLAAACVLLIGIIIGLIYSYNTTTQKQRELEKLLQQMKSSQQQTAPSEKQSASNTTESDDNGGVVNEPSITEGNEASQPAVTAGILLTEEEKKPLQVQKQKKVTSPDTKAKTDAPSAAEPIAVPAILTEVEKPRIDLLEQNRKNIFQKVTIENNKFKVGVLGGINDLQLTLTNRSLFQLEQVEVEVRYLGSENKVVKTQTVYFTNVSPGEKLSLKVPKSNRGVTVDYSVKKISTKVLGIASAG